MKFDIVLLDFPFSDDAGGKVRPALCLTDPNGRFEEIVVAFVSSQIPPALERSDLLLDPTLADFAVTGLKARSVLRLHKLSTALNGAIMRRLGTLPAALEPEVNSRLRRLFDL